MTTRASASSLLRRHTQAEIQQCECPVLQYSGALFLLTCSIDPRLNTFLELKMENQRLQHRIHELRAQKGTSIQTPSALTVSTVPSSFSSNPSPTTSSLSAQLWPPTVPDHAESTAVNPSPVTRNLDAAGFQEGEQDEPAKKKVGYF